MTSHFDMTAFVAQAERDTLPRNIRGGDYGQWQNERNAKAMALINSAVPKDIAASAETALIAAGIICLEDTDDFAEDVNDFFENEEPELEIAFEEKIDVKEFQ